MVRICCRAHCLASHSLKTRPRSHTEVERVACTVYVTNIERTVSKEVLLGFFSNLCGACALAWVEERASDMVWGLAG